MPSSFSLLNDTLVDAIRDRYGRKDGSPADLTRLLIHDLRQVSLVVGNAQVSDACGPKDNRIWVNIPLVASTLVAMTILPRESNRITLMGEEHQLSIPVEPMRFESRTALPLVASYEEALRDQLQHIGTVNRVLDDLRGQAREVIAMVTREDIDRLRRHRDSVQLLRNHIASGDQSKPCAA